MEGERRRLLERLATLSQSKRTARDRGDHAEATQISKRMQEISKELKDLNR